MHDGTLYNINHNIYRDNQKSELARRNPSTASIWSVIPLVKYMTNSPPTVTNDRVFVASSIEVFCLSASRNETLWQGPEIAGIHGSPTVSDGNVFVNSNGFESVDPQLRAFDAETGEERWRYEHDTESKSTPAVADGRVYISSTKGLHAIDAATGEQLFVVSRVQSEWSTPAVGADTVYVTSYDDEPEDLLAIDVFDGTVKWRVTSPGYEPPVVADDRVYTGTEQGVVALGKSDGQVRERLGGQGTPVARVGDVVYATGGGTIYALAANGEGELWSHTTEQVQIQDTSGRAVYGLTPVDGAVYASARGGFHGFGPPRRDSAGKKMI